jgi:hypothetical protein
MAARVAWISPTKSSRGNAGHAGVGRARSAGAATWGPTLESVGRAADVDKCDTHETNEAAEAARRGDRAFQAAMLAAIESGAEKVRQGVVRRAPATYVPRVTPIIESGYRSNAGWADEHGDAERYPHGSR